MDYGNLESVEHPTQKYEGAFHFARGGRKEAPTLVLLHGHMAHAIAFRRVWPRLCKWFDVMIPDLPGHGHDETFRGLQMQPSVETLSQWLFDLLDATVEGPVHIVGHSLGASIAYEAAHEQPERFCSMTLTSPGFCVTVPPAAAVLFELLPPSLARLGMNATGMKIIEPFRWQGQPLDAAEARAYIAPMKDVDRLEFALRLGASLVRAACDIDQLEAPEVPTMLLFGQGDDFVAVDAAAEIGLQLAARRVEVFSRAGHSPPEDTPAEFVDALLEFTSTEARCARPQVE